MSEQQPDDLVTALAEVIESSAGLSHIDSASEYIARAVLARTDLVLPAADVITRADACTCDTNPETTGGPEEDCLRHGRGHEGWIERAEELRAELDGLRADVIPGSELDLARADAIGKAHRVGELAAELERFKLAVLAFAEAHDHEWVAWECDERCSTKSEIVAELRLLVTGGDA